MMQAHEHDEDEPSLEAIRIITIIIEQDANGVCLGKSYHPGMSVEQALETLRVVVSGYEQEILDAEAPDRDAI